MEALGFQHGAEAVLETLTEDVLKSSDIEGEILDKERMSTSSWPMPGSTIRRG
jgi:hypothetical protein